MSDERYEYRVVEIPQRGPARVSMTCEDEALARQWAAGRRANPELTVRLDRRPLVPPPPWLPVPDPAPDTLPGVWAVGVWADRLIEELEGLDRWPPPQHLAALRQVSKGIALRDGDLDVLRRLAGWHEGRRATQRFVRDPLPQRISSAFSSLIFGREPEFAPASNADAKLLEQLVKDNNFRSELGRAARTASSEGEVWWRVYVDRDVALVPILEWHSRTSVYPLWVGSRLMAVAFVSRLRDVGDLAFRHFEVHEVDGANGGRVENVLFAERISVAENAAARQGADPARTRRLGDRVDLTEHPETESLAEEWTHGLPGMLGGRVANMIGTDPTLGVSDYADVEDFLVELCIAASIAHSNMELTARRRVVVPEDEVGPDGAVDVGEQVYVEAPDELGEGTGRGNYRVLEYTFDAEALETYVAGVERRTLSRVGLDAQYAGVDPAEGRAESGTALRMRLIPTDHAAAERGQDWDQQVPVAAMRLQEVDALAVDRGGFGRSWRRPHEPPAMNRGSALPEDRAERAERHSLQVSAKTMSRETAIREDHPDWDDVQVREELARIDRDARAANSGLGATLRLSGSPAPEGDEDEDEESPDRRGGEPDSPGGDAGTTAD